jgi:tetratricopeptide (TPR) repeat protein
MPDSLRTDSSRAAGGADPDRDAKIEQLLLVGLDHYFAAQYEQAINVWTRALFLDRGHARARAYIERARSALAERQRQSEELLQQGMAALQRGEGDSARRLLEAALHQGGPSDEALAALDRLSRLELGGGAQQQSPGASRDRAPREASDVVPPRAATPVRGLLGWATLGIVAVGAVSIAVIVKGSEWRAVLPLQPLPPPSLAPPPPADSGLPLPRRGETALARARALAATGHFREALAALDRIRPADAQRADADRLRAEIQQQLLRLPRASGLRP